MKLKKFSYFNIINKQNKWLSLQNFISKFRFLSFIPTLFLIISIFTVFVFFPLIFLSGCRQYDNKLDISYFFKTDPEKAVIDFLYALNGHDAEYIYSNFLLDSDRKKISKEKFINELTNILDKVENIEVERVVYLGFENEMSQVVAQFYVYYTNKNISRYKKYFYLKQEKNKWKIVFDKTFI